MMNALESTSTRPYLIRALYEWCTDNGLTPYVAVMVDDSVQVPREYVKDGEIVLNISFDATSSLQLGNDFIEFKARFAGVARDIMVPIGRVIAIYARENGQGMAFPAPAPAVLQPADPAATGSRALSGVAPSPARVKDSAPDESHVVQLVPPDLAGHDMPESPKPGPAGGGGQRPALKRIK